MVIKAWKGREQAEESGAETCGPEGWPARPLLQTVVPADLFEAKRPRAAHEAAFSKSRACDDKSLIRKATRALRGRPRLSGPGRRGMQARFLHLRDAVRV